ncbi:MAG: FecR family protein [bacterium]|nr:hypothetical protein [Pseudomonadales bacterium]
MDSNNGDQISEDQIARLLLKTGSRNKPSEALSNEIKANVKLAWQEEVEAQGRRRSTRFRYSVAAGFLLAMSIGIGVLTIPGHPSSSYATVAKVVNRVEYQLEAGGIWRDFEGAEIKGEIRVRTMANSFASIVMVNGLNLRIAQDSLIQLTGLDEVDLITGQIYVDSNDGGSRANSIVVTTPFGHARDIGTQFSVRVLRSNWQVQVREGSVEINHGDVVAFAGERILMAENASVQKSAIDTDDESWAWTQKVSVTFDLEGAALSSYLDWVSRETGKTLKYRSEVARNQAKRTMLHGSIKGLKPLESLRIVLATTDFYVVTVESGSFVVDR